MKKLIQPKDALILDLGPAHITEYGRSLLRPPGVSDAAWRYMGLEAASMSKHYEKAVLEHVLGKTELAKVTPIYMALCTTKPTVSSTGATLVEAAYTGYARREIPASSWSSAVEGEPTSETNGTAVVFAACTGSSSTIVGWALTDNSATSAGNVIFWGECASTVISTTQTPATIAIGGLVCNLT